MIWTAALWILTVACVVATVMPLVPVPHGAFRAFDFGRLQVISVSAVTLVLSVATTPLDDGGMARVLLLCLCIAVQGWHIIRFSPLWKTQSATFRGDPVDAAMLDLLVCNVKQGNRSYEKVAALLRERDPDIAVLIETDVKWLDALRDDLAHYPERIECPNDNTYGLIMVSKFPSEESEVRYLLNEAVPSLHCTLKMPNGRLIRFFAVHPEPPVPVRDTLGRDAEILTVGEIARDETLPVIVTGDLNDVAWSRTTRRFLRISRLLDPRQGRGLYSTFDARYPFIRWPLDHVFHSRDFEVITIERQPFVGSDHFPMHYTFALVEHDHNDEPPEATEEDIEEAEEAKTIEKNRNREPVGVDWEEK